MPDSYLSITATLPNRAYFQQFNGLFTVGKSGSITADKQIYLDAIGFPSLHLSRISDLNERKVKLLLAFPAILTSFVGSCPIPKTVIGMPKVYLHAYYRSTLPTFLADGKGSFKATDNILREAQQWLNDWRVFLIDALGQNVAAFQILQQGYCLINNTNKNKVEMMRLYLVSCIVMIYVTRRLNLPMPKGLVIMEAKNANGMTKGKHYQ